MDGLEAATRSSLGSAFRYDERGRLVMWNRVNGTMLIHVKDDDAGEPQFQEVKPKMARHYAARGLAAD